MPTHSSSNSSRAELRRQLRDARRALTTTERAAASLRAIDYLLAHPWYRCAQRIALYWPVGSEVDTSALLTTALQDGKQVFLPAILRRGGRLLFVRLRRSTNLGHRRHGIPQPRPASSRDLATTRRLDLVVMPLLGFDTRGHRVGSGAGYYDLSFGFRIFTPHGRPRLVGLGFACQQATGFEPGAWDVPLDAVVTDSGVKFFR